MAEFAERIKPRAQYVDEAIELALASKWTEAVQVGAGGPIRVRPNSLTIAGIPFEDANWATPSKIPLIASHAAELPMLRAMLTMMSVKAPFLTSKVRDSGGSRNSALSPAARSFLTSSTDVMV